jgi:purine-cytosine permease-like protein
MSEQTQVSILDQFLNKSLEYLSSAEAFLKAEVPAFVQEFMTWKYYEAMLSIGSKLFIAIILIIAANLLYKRYKKLYTEDRHDPDFVPYIVFSIVSGIAAFCMVVSLWEPIHTMVKIKVAPRVFLIEQVKELTNK